MRALIAAACFLSSTVSAEYYASYFTLEKVGGSSNSSSVFVYVSEEAKSSTCDNKQHFKLSDESKHADRFLSVMLTAQAQGKQVYIGYDHEDCFKDGTVPRVYYIQD